MRVTEVVWRVASVAGREAAQADRCQQLACAHVHHGTRADGVEQLRAKRHGEDLVGSQARIHLSTAIRYPLWSVDDVIEIAARRRPETCGETCCSLARAGGVVSCRTAIVHTARP